jgi:hypothetical protein
MLATLDVWARDASFGLARVEQGQVPSGSGTTIAGVSSHHLLTDLTVFDDHSQYAYLVGRGAGQTLCGGVNGVSSALTLLGSTLFASSYGYVHFTAAAGTGVTIVPQTGRIGINQTVSVIAHCLDIVCEGGVAGGVNVKLNNAGGSGNGINVEAKSVGQSVFHVANSGASTFLSYTGQAATTILLVDNTVGADGTIPLAVKAKSSQTASLQEWQDSTGTALSLVNKMGVFRGHDVVSDLTAQTGNITAQTLLTGTATTTAGMYRVSVYLKTTTAGGGGASVKATVAWNDGTAQTLDVSLIAAAVGVAHDLTVLNAHSQGSVVLNLAASQNITYTTTFTAGTGSPAYEIHVRTEALG